MKTKELLFFSIVLTMITFNISCNKDEYEHYIEVSDFRVVSASEFAPTEVYVITQKTYQGKNDFMYIHVGSDSERDTTETTSLTTEKMSYTDTLELYYSNPGSYTVSLDVGGQNYTDSFTLKSND
jgi:PKD repeat protein